MRIRGPENAARREAPERGENESRHERIPAVQHFFYGHAPVPAAKDLADAWRAVKAIAAAGGPLTRRSRLALEARMSATGAPPELVAEVLGWNERSERARMLLARTASADRRATAVWIVYEALSVVMADGGLGPSEVEPVCAAAATLDTSREAVDALAEVCREEAALRRRRIDMLCLKTESGYRSDLL